jgi:predicted membrane-bound mannosyltransferase
LAVERLNIEHGQTKIAAETQTLWTEVAAVGLIVLLGLFVRFYQLGAWSFWPDEIFSFGTKSDGFHEGLLRRSLATDLISLTVNWLGPSEWNARLVPALIGLASLPLLYLLLRRCMVRPAALSVLVLLAFSPWHVYWSQNARFYTLLFLFFNLGLLLFYLGFEEDRPWYLLASLVLFGLAARERLVALIGMPALVAYLLLLVPFGFARPKGLNWRNLLVFFGPAVVAGLVLVFPYVRNFEGWVQGFSRLNTTPFFLLAGTLYYVGLPLAAFAAGSALFAVWRKDRLALLLSLGALLPLVAIMAVSLVQYAANRYIFFSLFSWLALGGIGLQALYVRLVRDARVLMLVVLVALASAYAGDLYLYHVEQNGNRDDWRSAFAYIREHGQEGDTVVVSDFDVFQYYLGEPFVFQTWDQAPNAAEGEATGSGRVWYIEDMTVAERFPEGLAAMPEYAALAADFDVRLPGRNFMMRVYVAENP